MNPVGVAGVVVGGVAASATALFGVIRFSMNGAKTSSSASDEDGESALRQTSEIAAARVHAWLHQPIPTHQSGPAKEDEMVSGIKSGSALVVLQTNRQKLLQAACNQDNSRKPPQLYTEHADANHAPLDALFMLTIMDGDSFMLTPISCCGFSLAASGRRAPQPVCLARTAKSAAEQMWSVGPGGLTNVKHNSTVLRVQVIPVHSTLSNPEDDHAQKMVEEARIRDLQHDVEVRDRQLADGRETKRRGDMEVQRLQDQVQNLKKQLGSAQDQLTAAVNRGQERESLLQCEVAGLRCQLSSLRDQAQGWRAEAEKKGHERADKLKVENQALQAETKQLREELEQCALVEQEAQDLAQQLDEERERVAMLNQQLADEQERMWRELVGAKRQQQGDVQREAELQRRLVQREELCRELEQRAEAAELALEHCQVDLDASREDQREMTRQLRGLQEQLGLSQAALESQARQVHSYRSDLQQVREALTVAREFSSQQVDTANAALKREVELQDEMQQLQQQLDQRNKQVQALVDKCTKLGVAMQGIDMQLGTLQDTSLPASLRESIKASKYDQLVKKFSQLVRNSNTGLPTLPGGPSPPPLSSHRSQPRSPDLDQSMMGSVFASMSVRASLPSRQHSLLPMRTVTSSISLQRTATQDTTLDAALDMQTLDMQEGGQGGDLMARRHPPPGSWTSSAPATSQAGSAGGSVGGAVQGQVSRVESNAGIVECVGEGEAGEAVGEGSAGMRCTAVRASTPTLERCTSGDEGSPDAHPVASGLEASFEGGLGVAGGDDTVTSMGGTAEDVVVQAVKLDRQLGSLEHLLSSGALMAAQQELCHGLRLDMPPPLAVRARTAGTGVIASMEGRRVSSSLPSSPVWCAREAVSQSLRSSVWDAIARYTGSDAVARAGLGPSMGVGAYTGSSGVIGRIRASVCSSVVLPRESRGALWSGRGREGGLMGMSEGYRTSRVGAGELRQSGVLGGKAGGSLVRTGSSKLVCEPVGTTGRVLRGVKRVSGADQIERGIPKISLGSAVRVSNVELGCDGVKQPADVAGGEGVDVSISTYCVEEGCGGGEEKHVSVRASSAVVTSINDQYVSNVGMRYVPPKPSLDGILNRNGEEVVNGCKEGDTRGEAGSSSRGPSGGGVFDSQWPQTPGLDEPAVRADSPQASGLDEPAVRADSSQAAPPQDVPLLTSVSLEGHVERSGSSAVDAVDATVPADVLVEGAVATVTSRDGVDSTIEPVSDATALGQGHSDLVSGDVDGGGADKGVDGHEGGRDEERGEGMGSSVGGDNAQPQECVEVVGVSGESSESGMSRASSGMEGGGSVGVMEALCVGGGEHSSEGEGDDEMDRGLDTARGVVPPMLLTPLHQLRTSGRSAMRHSCCSPDSDMGGEGAGGGDSVPHMAPVGGDEDERGGGDAEGGCKADGGDAGAGNEDCEGVCVPVSVDGKVEEVPVSDMGVNVDDQDVCGALAMAWADGEVPSDVQMVEGVEQEVGGSVDGQGAVVLVKVEGDGGAHGCDVPKGAVESEQRDATGGLMVVTDGVKSTDDLATEGDTHTSNDKGCASSMAPVNSEPTPQHALSMSSTDATTTDVDVHAVPHSSEISPAPAPLPTPTMTSTRDVSSLSVITGELTQVQFVEHGQLPLSSYQVFEPLPPHLQAESSRDEWSSWIPPHSYEVCGELPPVPVHAVSAGPSSRRATVASYALACDWDADE